MKTLYFFLVFFGFAAGIFYSPALTAADKRLKKTNEVEVKKATLKIDAESLADIEKRLIEDYLSEEAVQDVTTQKANVYDQEGNLCYSGDINLAGQALLNADFIFEFNSIAYYLLNER